MTTCQTLQNACICPPAAGQSFMKAGVFSQTGQYVEESIVWRGTKAMLQAPEPPQNPQKSLSGCHLYAGYLSNHFGHFQCESLARLWPLGNSKNQIEWVLESVGAPNSKSMVEPDFDPSLQSNT